MKLITEFGEVVSKYGSISVVPSLVLEVFVDNILSEIPEDFGEAAFVLGMINTEIRRRESGSNRLSNKQIVK